MARPSFAVRRVPRRKARRTPSEDGGLIPLWGRVSPLKMEAAGVADNRHTGLSDVEGRLGQTGM